MECLTDWCSNAQAFLKGFVYQVEHGSIMEKQSFVVLVGNGDDKVAGNNFIRHEAVFIEERFDILINIIGMKNLALEKNRYKPF